LIAGSLFVIAIILAPFSVTRKSIASLMLFLVSIAASEGLSAFRYQQNKYQDIDTQYARLSLFESTEPVTGKPIRVISNDPHFLQSAIFLDDDQLVFAYTKYFHLSKYFVPEMKHSLMIGGAGYSFPRDYLTKYPDATMDVVEIDPEMTAIAREHFRLIDDQRMRIYHADARVFLKKTDQKYDVVFMDAFGTLFSVPYHLTTQESMREVRRVLNDDGVLIMNLGGALAGPGSGFFRAEIATLKSVFSTVRIFKVKDEKRLDEMQNLIIVASNQALSGSQRSDNFQAFLGNEFVADVPMDLPILTDDLAPVEYYNSFAQNSFR
jgi:SAM-dependent methyltransferase